MDAADRRAVVVFTRDLRVDDNPALTAACAVSDAIVPLFVLDERIAESAGVNRVGFLVDSLRDLDRSLRRLGGHLVLRRGDWVEEVLAAARAADARAVHLAADVSGYAQQRVARLRRAAGAVGMVVHEHPGTTVVPPGELRPASGHEYKVFTPYHRRWSATRWRSPVPPPRRVVLAESGSTRPGAGIEELEPLIGAVATAARSPGVQAGGEREATARLATFLDTAGQDESRRDALAADATSRMSAYLHFGCMSATRMAGQLAAVPGGDAVVRQLCWRDFFHQLLAARPDAAHADYRPDGRQWVDDADAFDAWRSGHTGYPLVDAAMRQLTAEGFVHNRARMVVASFLCKDLHIDWRLGADHFMSWLVDGDVANNQLNWQWVAGTGSDTNPHRIFNPVTQGRRYDPAGDYIRRYLPELADVGGDAVHWPDDATRRRAGYPSPIVDHHEAIAAYRARQQGRPA